jgi:hypothetical protein
MRNDADRGSATAETAVVLPVLLAALAVCIWGLVLVSASLRCAEAARAGARVAARREPPEAVNAAARRAAGLPVRTTITHDDANNVTVTATYRAGPTLPVLRLLLPAVTIRESATAHVEPRAGPP